jgi:hypothetical protein
LMASVVARAEIVFQLPSELFGDGWVFHEYGVFAVSVRLGEGCGRYVFSYP